MAKNRAQNRATGKQYKEALDEVYRRYYLERHEFEDKNIDPNQWELQLWEKCEDELIEVHRKLSK